MEESEKESVQKIINKEKYAIDETDHEEPLVTGIQLSRSQSIRTYSSVVKYLEQA